MVLARWDQGLQGFLQAALASSKELKELLHASWS